MRGAALRLRAERALRSKGVTGSIGRLWAVGALLAGGLSGQDGDGIVFERYSTRPGGPAHWLGLHPVESEVRRSGAGAYRYPADGGGFPEGPVPSILLDCKVAEPGSDFDPEPWPLAGLVTVRRFRSEPHALQIVNPLHWPLLLLYWTSPYYDERGDLEWRRDGASVSGRGARVVRDRWQYSTDSSYDLRLKGGEAFQAMRGARRVELRVDAPGFSARGVYEVGGATQQFLDACAGTVAD